MSTVEAHRENGQEYLAVLGGAPLIHSLSVRCNESLVSGIIRDIPVQDTLFGLDGVLKPIVNKVEVSVRNENLKKNYSWPNTLPKDQKFTHCDFEYLVLSRVEARHFTVNPDHRASIKVKWSSGHSVSGWFRRESAVSRPERPMEDRERRSHTPKKANLQICELQ